jgi:hypothetical protein
MYHCIIKYNEMDFSDIAGSQIDDKHQSNEIIDTNTLFVGQLIRIDETPNQPSWKLVPLFSDRIQGDTRVWQIGFDNSISQLKTIHGVLITTKGEVGENLQTAYHPIEINKSGRNMQEQALLEARRKYLNKYKEGYLPSGEDLPAELNGAKPMLAKKYRHPSVNDKPLDSNETRIKNFPVSVMRKIDGIRALGRLHGNKIVMRSRLNNLYPHLHHIKQELEGFLRYLPSYCELDGELYSLEMNFQELTSVVKRVIELHPRHSEVEYWIFDIIDPQRMVWEDRYAMLVNAYIKYLEDGNTAKTFRILQAYTANSPEEIDKYHNQFVSEGYEGIIIRRYGCVEKDRKMAEYRPNRTNNLVKYKFFQDEEVTITGYESCVGTEEGAIKFIVRDIRGNEFSVRPRGSIEKRKEWFKSGNDFIGKQLTIRFQELSTKGVPRFPVAVGLRDYE